MAGVLEKQGRCSQCGAVDSFVPIENAERDVFWAEHDRRKFRVQPVRCLGCASREFIARVTAADDPKGEPAKTSVAPREGRYFAPSEITESAAQPAPPDVER